MYPLADESDQLQTEGSVHGFHDALLAQLSRIPRRRTKSSKSVSIANACQVGLQYATAAGLALGLGLLAGAILTAALLAFTGLYALQRCGQNC
jgi:hypothetical protein